MGDRANIVVYDGNEQANPYEAVFLYTHWSGYELPERLKAGLVRGEDRWNDAPYLARVLFQEMVRGDGGISGFGISTRMGDNSYPLLVVDCTRGVVVEYPEAVYAEVGFAKLGTYRGSAFASYAGKWKKKAAE